MFRPPTPFAFRPSAPSLTPSALGMTEYDREPPDPGAVKEGPEDAREFHGGGIGGENDEEMGVVGEEPGVEEKRQSKKARKRNEGTDDQEAAKESYLGKLLDQAPRGSSGRTMFFDEGNHEEIVVKEAEDVDVGNVIISDELGRKYAKDWEAAVVVRLVGKKIMYETLKNRLSNMWRMVSEFSVLDVENNFYIIRFASAEDRQTILNGGPWVIMGHYLHVEKWEPDFDPWNHAVSNVVAWIRLPGLPIHLYRAKVIMAITKRLGPVVAWDNQTQCSGRGRYARVAVRINLEKPLCAKYKINGKLYRIEYENLPLICFHCGRYGHVKDTCSELISVQANGKGNSSGETHVNCGGDLARDDRLQACEKEGYGEWMVVDRRRRGGGNKTNQATVQMKKGDQQRGSGSRYEILVEEASGAEGDQERSLSGEGVVFSSKGGMQRMRQQRGATNEDKNKSLDNKVKSKANKGGNGAGFSTKAINDKGKNKVNFVWPREGASIGTTHPFIGKEKTEEFGKNKGITIGNANKGKQDGIISGSKKDKLVEAGHNVYSATSSLDPQFHKVVIIEKPLENTATNSSLIPGDETGQLGRPPEGDTVVLLSDTDEVERPNVDDCMEDSPENAVGIDEGNGGDPSNGYVAMDDDPCLGTVVPCSVVN